jgi:hypothetical protein
LGRQKKIISEASAARRPRASWIRVIAGGTLWAAVYNMAWGVAWFLFMRNEWRDAFASTKSPLLFTAEIWILWIVLTLPMGMGLVAYAANPGRSISAAKAAFYAGTALWLVMTLGMTGWARSFSARIIVLDATVNLIALMVASLAIGWSQRKAPA